ncbi:hypothetical protein BHE74_00055720 [Ensete ventricosum]|nr:hypothetical protein BHE74_00055720 [Ensete ventricosum]
MPSSRFQSQFASKSLFVGHLILPKNRSCETNPLALSLSLCFYRREEPFYVSFRLNPAVIPLTLTTGASGNAPVGATASTRSAKPTMPLLSHPLRSPPRVKLWGSYGDGQCKRLPTVLCVKRQFKSLVSNVTAPRFFRYLCLADPAVSYPSSYLPIDCLSRWRLAGPTPWQLSYD